MGSKAKNVFKKYYIFKGRRWKTDQVLAKFEAHFIPEKNTFREKFEFHSRAPRRIHNNIY